MFQAIGGGETGGDVVDEDSVFAEFVGETLNQADDSGADGVGEHEVGDGLLRGNGSDGDDAAPALFLHVGDDFAGKIDGAHEVRVDGVAPVGGGGGEEAPGGRAAGVGDADVDGTVAGYHSFDETVHGTGVGDVEGLGEHFGVVLLTDFFGGGGEDFEMAGAHGDARAFGGEGVGGGESDALAGGGDNSDAVAEAGVHGGGL